MPIIVTGGVPAPVVRRLILLPGGPVKLPEPEPT